MTTSRRTFLARFAGASALVVAPAVALEPKVVVEESAGDKLWLVQCKDGRNLKVRADGYVALGWAPGGVMPTVKFFTLNDGELTYETYLDVSRVAEL